MLRSKGRAVNLRSRLSVRKRGGTSRPRPQHRDPDGGGTLVLVDGVRLRVARGRWEAMERALEMEEF